MRNKRKGLDDELDLNLGRRGTNFVVPASHRILHSVLLGIESASNYTGNAKTAETER
jgi:hypothetical protein